MLTGLVLQPIPQKAAASTVTEAAAPQSMPADPCHTTVPNVERPTEGGKHSQPGTQITARAGTALFPVPTTIATFILYSVNITPLILQTSTTLHSASIPHSSAIQSKVQAEEDCSTNQSEAYGLGHAQLGKIATRQAVAEHCASHAGAPASKVSVQPVLLKRSSGRGQKGGGCAAVSPACPLGAATAAGVTRFVNKARMELAKLEIEIPWEAVHSIWRTQRAQWRK